ncbi:hypothetical protein BUALT_Bualt11G0089700 [Buddleja alternifolia]|uniref:LRAT domain-containing protein n=1 Tax=Buddleja alternifolia TaxID=168488 RepID=A0AAV6X0V7_9LAMI|nr:hypothetical protein BUALT_Bualt11G0089700 [Buddleja alternifolia]
MGLLSNRVNRSSLKPGDHIYSWRTAYIYSHHEQTVYCFLKSSASLSMWNVNTVVWTTKGIYIGDDKVIHFTRRGQEVGTGTILDYLLVSSGPTHSHIPCPTCIPPQDGHGVVSSCLTCFLAGGILYRFEYSVSPALFLAKARGGTCTLAISDPDEIVIHRANYLLENGFGCYNLFKNNCEDFALYCKTGLLLTDERTMGLSGQAVSIIGGPLAAVVSRSFRLVVSRSFRLVATNVYGMATDAVWNYCACRYAADIGMRRDVEKVEVEDLTRRRRR